MRSIFAEYNAGRAGGKQVNIFEKDIRALRGWAEREKERQMEQALCVREAQRSIGKEVERLVKGLVHVLERGWDRGR